MREVLWSLPSYRNFRFSSKVDLLYSVLSTQYAAATPRRCAYSARLNDFLQHFPRLLIAAFDTGHVVLHDAVAALAEILAEGFFDASIDLFVGHAAVAAIGRELEEPAQQHDALHAHLQVGD